MNELLKAALAVKKDLLMRAEVDNEGIKVVDVSSSIWRNFCDAIELENTRTQSQCDKQVLKHISTIYQADGCGVIFLLNNAATCSNKFISGFHGGGKYGKDDFILFDDDGEILIGVTHWMPLPTPPKEPAQ